MIYSCKPEQEIFLSECDEPGCKLGVSILADEHKDSHFGGTKAFNQKMI